MQSLISSPRTDERPWGVAAVCGLLALVGVAALVFAGLLIVHVVPLSYGSVLLQAGLEQAGPIAFMIYGAVALTLARGLWTRRNWARRLTILLAGVGVALAVPAISAAVVDGRLWSVAREGLQIMVRVAVIFYLTQEPVHEWFATRRP
jgi:hypothetical protein